MGKPSEQRQEEIVISTIDLCAEQGVNKITTQVIADRVGVAQATIFKHFKTRDHVFEAVLRWLSGRMFKAVEPMFKSEASADVRLQNIICKQLEFASKHKALPRILFSDRLHSDSSVLKGIVQQVMARMTEAFTQLIQDGMDSGVFANQQSAQVMAKLVVSTMQGTLMRWSIHDYNFELQAEGQALYGYYMQALLANNPAPWSIEDK
ncbi:MAG: TetR/AcrR family transcriptional regulator [Gammaproteobacteria bacterium]|nr:TetR/AcrR family transcriptional regulator [Gammaproteobacteria bacterium]